MYCWALQSHFPLMWPQNRLFLVPLQRQQPSSETRPKCARCIGLFFSESNFSVHERLLADVSWFPSSDQTVALPFMNTNCSLRSSSLDSLLNASGLLTAASVKRIRWDLFNLHTSAVNHHFLTGYDAVSLHLFYCTNNIACMVLTQKSDCYFQNKTVEISLVLLVCMSTLKRGCVKGSLTQSFEYFIKVKIKKQNIQIAG